MTTDSHFLRAHQSWTRFSSSHLWHGNLEHVVAHTQGGRVDSGDDDNSSVWTGQGSRVSGKVEGDVDPTVIKQGQWLQMTWTRRRGDQVTKQARRGSRREGGRSLEDSWSSCLAEHTGLEALHWYGELFQKLLGARGLRWLYWKS